MCKPLEGQVALVTGASRGIGRAIALELGRQGAAVVVNYATDETGANAVYDELIDLGSPLSRIAQADVTQRSAVEEMITGIVRMFDRLDILVNNAGITRDNLLLRLSDDDWDQVLDVNLRGAMLTTRAVLRPMLRQRYGRIVNITSAVGLMGNAGQSNYAAAKAGLIGFTKSVAREVASRQITVNAVAPGYIKTAMTDTVPEAIKAAVLKEILLGRFGEPEDVAPIVALLASAGGRYITGQVINVDGGLAMG